MAFITDNFLLQTDVAETLYHTYAKDLPIIDYHCHLSPKDIAENHKFKNLYEIWLTADHYKWRVMRGNGFDEAFCTGNASDKEKFLAFTKTVPETLRNPMYHWCHLELLRYFDIDLPINEANAEEIWTRANAQLGNPELSAQGILDTYKVSVVCTTDDPADELIYHEAIKSLGLKTKVYPTFRPDPLLFIHKLEIIKPWLQRLERVTGVHCSDFSGLLEALTKRHDDFHRLGCRLSDHGLTRCYTIYPSEKEASRIYEKALKGESLQENEVEAFGGYMMHFFGLLDAERGWTKQMHLGPLRNNSSRLMASYGPDAGADSIGDFPQAEGLAAYLDSLDSIGKLPKMVLYNINPADNHLFASMCGNFLDGSTPGKIQWGSAWWFVDQIDGIETQINVLSQVGMLSKFVGMLTDSRSFMSYCRHEYFRRLLCDILGRDVHAGRLPKDMSLLGRLVENICYFNASKFFGFELGDYSATPKS